MATLAQGLTEAPPPGGWLWDFLRNEMAPYPGRMATVGRIVLSATLVMIICDTYKIPYAFLGAIFTLVISRESPQSTVRSAGMTCLLIFFSAAYVLIGAWFVISIPSLHFFWNIASFFLAFYLIATLTNYATAIVFAFIISAAIPLWDTLMPAEVNVELTLWIVLSALIGAAAVVAVELVFVRTGPGYAIVRPITARLAAVRSVLLSYAEGRPPDRATKDNILRMRAVGTSRVRGLLQRSAYSRSYRLQMSGVAALTGRLVDTAVTLMQIPSGVSSSIQTRARDLAAAIGSIHDDLREHRIPAPVQFETGVETTLAASLLDEMEDAVTLLPETFAGSRTISEYLASADDLPQPKLVAGDTLFNPDHVKFALRGCLAASGAYIIYNAIDWPGISTAVTTCLLTALSTVGASRQKGFLRILGALLGGILGMGTQVFLLPSLNSITEFAVVFAAVTFLAAWILTSSARLAYAGFQTALAFYLIHLQEFGPQTSLSVARDRAVGVLFGLFMMWLVFDHLWAVSAVAEMKAAFISAIRLLAQLTREPSSSDIQVAIKRSYVLNGTLNAQMDKVRSAADAVLFEFGPSRQQDLALRDRIRRWQPHLRALFLMRRASLRYALRLPGFELPEAGQAALRQYNAHSAGMLEIMADRIEGREREIVPEPEDTSQLLEQVCGGCGAVELNQLPEHIRSFVLLLRKIDTVTHSLAEEMVAG
jgi:multidrug resistance protein MdtO